jgi:hypothetical protein
MDELVIERRFRGPQNSGNGGYTCGRIAALLDAETVEVTLRLPPPLDRPLRVERRSGGVRILDGDALVAEAHPAELELALPEAPSFAEAERLAARHAEEDHPFPGCFTCGPARAEGDGLRLRPVPAGDGRIVAPWQPSERLAGPGPLPRELAWASLDCPGAHAVTASGSRGLSVLGRLTAHVAETPAAGDGLAARRRRAASPRRDGPVPGRPAAGVCPRRLVPRRRRDAGRRHGDPATLPRVNAW